MSTRKNQIHEEWYQKLKKELSLEDSKQKKAILEIIATIDDYFDVNSLEGHIDGLHGMLSGSIENQVLGLSKKTIFDCVSQTGVHINFLLKLSSKLSVLKT
ncbi:hypothetical protein L0P88_21930 [Muricauda sp. SCSIO 64092]|uniref:hypothetical protein n=1 Tax=Allomuricauda sp. SCSIO 64092 TaxID=2908842 RepID=UPI001FF3BA85|nr:hypothetical protein [Muricauda sp. SCSIO 64092]UOY06569.1 hypothetical protein L0P88_21930 [Muricauda sp. SCSIO 64092]